MEIGKHLKEFRQYKKMTQKELAKTLNLPTSYIREIEAGNLDPYINFRSLMEEKFDFKDEYLLIGIGKMFIDENSRRDVYLMMENEVYKLAPRHAKKRADKYNTIFNETTDMNDRELKEFIKEWNKDYLDYLGGIYYTDRKTSYESFIRAAKDYGEYGIFGLLTKHGEYGKWINNADIKDEWFEYYKSLYLKERGLSILECWVETFIFLKKLDKNIEARYFPSPISFNNRLKKEISEEEIYKIRKENEKDRRIGLHPLC